MKNKPHRFDRTDHRYTAQNDECNKIVDKLIRRWSNCKNIDDFMTFSISGGLLTGAGSHWVGCDPFNVRIYHVK